VWASQCLAFIRYYGWLRQWYRQLPDYYDRWAPPRLEWQTKRPLLSSGQPIVAWVGLIGCLLIVFVLSTARWWNGSFTIGKFATAFAGVRLEATSVCREKIS
jgi:yeast amino acid transporter